MNFILLAVMTLCAQGTYYQRQIAITAMVCIARLELAAYLLYRVLKRGKDARFDEMRSNFWAFAGFWVFQGLWAFVVCLDVIYVNGDPTNPPFGDSRDIAGIIVFAIGFIIEVAADLQKDAFRSNPANKAKVCDVGVWHYSRHPNFFGEIMLWWGIFITASPVFATSSQFGQTFGLSGYGWGYATILSPIFTFLILMCLSGMPTAEGDNQKRFMRTKRQKEEYLAYRERTSVLIPLPTTMYRALPLWVKRWFLFEWPMYETDWSYCGEDSNNGAQASPLVQGQEAGPVGAAEGRSAKGSAGEFTPITLKQ
jgi:steroid 5-alpha reductase family enzyme